MLIPFVKEESVRPARTIAMFDNNRKRVDVLRSANQLLPFILSLEKYFSSIERMTGDEDFVFVSDTVDQVGESLVLKS